MPDTLPALVFAYAVVFLVNLAPAFMPPTWSILAFFVLRFDLPLLPLAIGGAAAATCGRVVLALVSRRSGRALLRPRERDNLLELGVWLDSRARWAAPLAVLFYSFGPVPSNQLFIAAGLTGMRLLPIAGAFLGGRLISYPFWVSAARVVADQLESLFLTRWTSIGTMGIELLTLIALVALTRVPWGRFVHRSSVDGGRTGSGSGAGQTGSDA